MKKIKYIAVAAFLMMLASCGSTSTVPLTGRSHRISVSDEQILSLSTQQYQEYMQKATKSTNTKNTQMVERVGRKLATAVENYLKNNGYADDVKNYNWEFNLVQSNEANAFCMPGGKIVVYEGLLPYTQNEASLAVVLGHEIAHAVAKHSAEQLTKQQNQSVATSVLGTVLNSTVGSGVGDVASKVASTGFSLMNLKYSRTDESEADYMGLIFAAMAGYDPSYAVSFWQRMAQSTSSSSTSEWLSDHPSDEKRIANIQKWMPEAQKYYEATKPATTTKATTTTKKASTTKKKQRQPRKQRPPRRKDNYKNIS